jgi:hypothetical protein
VSLSDQQNVQERTTPFLSTLPVNNTTFKLHHSCKQPKANLLVIMSTSLQRAVGSNTASKPIAKPQSKGAFESCFAQGLDLSEFAAPSNHHQKPVSASAALLAVKKEESQRRHQQEREDAQMAHTVQQRAERLREASKSMNDRKAVTAAALSGSGIGGFLVQMHKGDDTVRSKASRAMKKKLPPPKVNSKNNSKKGKAAVKKTKKRSKH